VIRKRSADGGKSAEPELDPGALCAELEAAALRALVSEYDELNWSLFRSELHRPELEFSESRVQLGSFSTQPRTIRIARHLLFGPWGRLAEVLKHEMAHQYVAEVLAADAEPPHGPSFQRVCRARGIDARATGEPLGTKAANPVLERIAKLLALAESPNEHEAQAAMNKAQELLLRHNLDASDALRKQELGFVHLGEPTGRVREPARIVARILADHFFVQPIWTSVWRPLEGKSGKILEICGRDANLRIASYVHDFLHHTAHELWLAHKRQHRIRRDRDRMAFLAGVMTGFWRRLADEKRRNLESGLVPRGDSEAGRYFKRRYPRQTNVRYQSSAGSAAHQAGHEAGRKLVLRKPVDARSGGGSSPLALPASRTPR